MNIYDILPSDDGQAVVAGTASHLDSLSLAEIKQLVGISVTIVTGTDSGEEVFGVLGVGVSESLIGKKNLFLKFDIPFENAKNLMGSEALPTDRTGDRE
jgi:hypothetical protein